MRHLVVRLEAPLMAFGGETIDAYGVIRPFPALSMLTGLCANALGWRRTEQARHQALQDRLVCAARIDREPGGEGRLTDFQTAAIHHWDESWTTRGAPEGRAGGTYQNHLRWRDYYADMCVTVALRLDPPQAAPTLADLAAALQEPLRPLYIGRKSCLPAAPLYGGFAEGETALAALLATPGVNAAAPSCRLLWPVREGVDTVKPIRTYLLTDQRNWVSGAHGGGRTVCEGVTP